MLYLLNQFEPNVITKNQVLLDVFQDNSKTNKNFKKIYSTLMKVHKIFRIFMYNT